MLGSGEHFFTVSTGIALAATRSTTRPESLLGDADAAMYRAKERGRGRYELFDEAMRTSVMTRVRTETELRRALDRGELERLVPAGRSTWRPAGRSRPRRSCAGSTPSAA